MHDILLHAFGCVITASWQAGLISVVVAAVQFALGRRLAPTLRAAMWTLVVLRLALPALPQSRFSLFNLLQKQARPESIEPAPRTEAVVLFGPDVTTSTNPLPLTSPSNNTPNHATFNWRLVCASLWLLVAFLLLIRVVVGSVQFRRILRTAAPCTDERLLNLMESCRAGLGAPPVKILEIDMPIGPALAGAIRPVLLLQSGIAAHLSDVEARFIFLHELTHARSRDLLANWLLALIVILHWFNPAAWIAWRRIRLERELACDEVVLSNSSHDQRMRYGQTILRVFDEFATSPAPRFTAAMSDSPGSLRRRIQAIAHPAGRSASITTIALLATLVIGCTTLTAPKAPTTQQEKPVPGAAGLVTRAYDIRDLLVEIPNFDNAPDFNLRTDPSKPHSPGAGNSNKPSRQDLVDRLIRQIEASVDPSSWQMAGPATIRETDGQLIISQTTENHAQISKLLAEMRSKRGMQVMIESRFIHASPKDLEAWQKPGGDDWKMNDDFEVWSQPLSEPQVKSLLGSVQADQDASTITSPRVTVFNGQRAYVVISTTQAYLKDLHPSTSATQPAMSGYDPEIGTVESGIRLDVQAQVTADQRYVTLTLKPQISNLISMDNSPWPGAPAGRSDLVIQIPHVRIATLNATFSIPDRQTLLFRVHPKDQPESSARTSPETIYFLVRPQIISQAQTESKPSPLLSANPATQASSP